MSKPTLLEMTARTRFKTKLTFSSALIASVALLLAWLGLLGVQFLTEERLAQQRHDQIMQVIAANTGPALMFVDAEAARENLMSIRGIDDVSKISILDAQGTVFAEYENSDALGQDKASQVAIRQSAIVVDGELLGKLIMEV